MSEQSKPSTHIIPRRILVKGLLGAALAFVEIGCTPGSPLPHAAITPPLSRSSPTPATLSTTTSQTPGAPFLTYRGHTGLINAVVWHDRRIASGGADATIQVWDSITGQTLLTYRSFSGLITAITWSPDGKWIASAGNDTAVQVWNATTGNELLAYHNHTGFIYDVAWSPDGRSIASASWDGTARIWDATTGKDNWTYKPGYRVWTAEWSPDSSYLAIMSGGAVQVWHIANRHLTFTYPFNGYAIAYATRWSPNGQRLASALNDNTAQVWDAITGHHPLVYRGHTGAVVDVAWSPNGTYLASSGVDKTVQVWHATTGTPLFTYHGHTDIVTQLAWSPDGKWLASGSNDGTVQICRAL